MDEDGGRRGEPEQIQKAAVHHVEWREGPGQRKRKKRTGEDAEHLVLRHEDSLQCLAMETDFYVFLSAGPGSILKLMVSKTSQWHQAPQEERPLPLRILILKSMLEELHNRTLKLQSTDSSDPLIQALVRLKFL